MRGFFSIYLVSLSLTESGYVEIFVNICDDPISNNLTKIHGYITIMQKHVLTFSTLVN